MMGLVSHGRRRTTSNASHRSRSSSEGASHNVGEDDTQVIEADEGNVLSHIISQLRPGADLSRVVLPTFILEPRSMLERITNFMCHPEMLLPIPEIEDPVERFVSVVKFYLSGWHIRPPGVKKPLNPILGEIFTCYWDLPDKTRAYYISEQTSHHPPKSSYFYMVPEHNIRVDGTLKPRSKFLGNSAASLMEGTAILSILNRGKDPSKGERYVLTQPNMYARGIIVGKMKYELGDHSYVKCPELGLTADIEFKTKGWVSGTYNAIGGMIRNEHTGENLYELSGLWSEEMFIKNLKTGQNQMFFNATKSKPSNPLVRPIEEQEERESQRLWLKTARAVKARDHELATDEKTKIEDMQREEAAKRASEGVEWRPRLFRRVKGGPGGPEEGEEDLEWIINARIDAKSPEKIAEQITAIYPVITGQQPNQKNYIPPRTSVSGEVSQPAPQAVPPPQPSQPKPEDDLIDFGQHDDTPQLQQPLQPGNHERTAPEKSVPEKSTTEIQQMLQSTGKQAEGGALIDFQEDMKKAVPSMKRSETAESNDVFHDARD